MAILPSPAPLVRALLGITLVLVIGGCREDAEAPTEGGAAPQLAVSGQPLSFRQIAAGGGSTCGVTTADIAYCWGNNLLGQLGDGTRTLRVRPVKVAGGLKFREIRPGDGHTCGLTTDSLAYCWGDNDNGAVGDNSTELRRLVPTLVFGGHHWRQVSAGFGYTCGIAAGGATYCWGDNRWGVFGLPGSGPVLSRKPVKISGSLMFSRIQTAFSHTCAATIDNRAYCWGNNSSGQLGDGTTTSRGLPTPVAGGLSFRLVVPAYGFIPSAGSDPDFAYTCGITTDNRLYCWGITDVQRLGTRPVAVAPTRRFESVKPGNFHICALAISGAALCWGDNTWGQLGTGGPTTTTPTTVAGGHTFDGVGVFALGDHSCGVTTDHRAFCWGRNASGQLGDGSQSNRATPVAVAGPS